MAGAKCGRGSPSSAASQSLSCSESPQYLPPYVCGMDVTSFVRPRCLIGAPSCSLTAYNDQFGGADPCPQQPKHLIVFYQCRNYVI